MRENLQHALTRAHDHQAFQRALLRDPDNALLGYALTPTEQRAIRDRDGALLLRLGVAPELAGWWAEVGSRGETLPITAAGAEPPA